MAVSDSNAQTVVQYLEHLRMQKLKPQSYNNKIQGTIKFIAYLQVKGFFYKNEQVRAALDAARQEKEGEHLIRIRKEIVEYSIEKENELYKRELEKLKKENEELKKENQKLKKALDKTSLAYLELL